MNVWKPSRKLNGSSTRFELAGNQTNSKIQYMKREQFFLTRSIKKKEKKEKVRAEREREKTDSTKIAPAPQSINTYIRTKWETVSYNNQRNGWAFDCCFFCCCCCRLVLLHLLIAVFVGITLIVWWKESDYRIFQFFLSMFHRALYTSSFFHWVFS